MPLPLTPRDPAVVAGLLPLGRADRLLRPDQRPVGEAQDRAALPLDGTPSNYLDLWHEGVWGGADSIFAFDIARGISTVVALPGGRQGGVVGDVAALAVSPDGQYLLFINKGDRTLWGVRLAQ